VSNKIENQSTAQNAAFSPEAILLSQQMSQQLALKNNSSDEIDLAEIWRAIWSGKLTIIAISLVFAVSSMTFALSKPDIYKASVLLTPTSSDGGSGGLSALAGQFGSLASMAGINLGGGGVDKTGLALEVIKSRAFIERFIQKNNLLVPLMAVERWDMYNDKLIYDEDVYNSQVKQWIRDVNFPKKPEPSPWESFDYFSRENLSLSQDKESGMVTISIKYYSPEMAKEWLTLLVKEINSEMKSKDQTEAKESIDFLTKKLEQTNLTEMKNVFYQLIEEQTKTMMLTEVSDEYVLKTIDPAQVPDKKDQPKRALIVLLGTMLGGILSILIVLIGHFTNKKNSSKPKEDILA